MKTLVFEVWVEPSEEPGAHDLVYAIADSLLERGTDILPGVYEVSIRWVKPAPGSGEGHG